MMSLRTPTLCDTTVKRRWSITSVSGRVYVVKSPDNLSNDAVCGTVVGDHQGSLLGSIPMTVMTDSNLTPDGLPAVNLVKFVVVKSTRSVPRVDYTLHDVLCRQRTVDYANLKSSIVRTLISLLDLFLSTSPLVYSSPHFIHSRPTTPWPSYLIPSLSNLLNWHFTFTFFYIHHDSWLVI